MGDTKGGGGRGRARGAGGTIAVTYQTAVEGGQTARIPNADNVLRLHFAGRLNNATNPGRQRVLGTQASDLRTNRTRADDERDWVSGYRAGFTNPRSIRTNVANNPAFVNGQLTGIRDLQQYG